MGRDEGKIKSAQLKGLVEKESGNMEGSWRSTCTVDVLTWTLSKRSHSGNYSSFLKASALSEVPLFCVKT